MSTHTIRSLGFALCAVWSSAIGINAQDAAPVVDSEVIGFAPLRTEEKPLIEMVVEAQGAAGSEHALPIAAEDASANGHPQTAPASLVNSSAAPLPQPRGAVSILLRESSPPPEISTVAQALATWLGAPAARLIAEALDPRLPAPPHLTLPEINPANCSSPPVDCGRLSVAESATSAVASNDGNAGRPTPLSSRESRMFAATTDRSPESLVSESPRLRSKSVAGGSIRMPQMKKMFSFDTIDKVVPGSVEPALAVESPPVLLDLASPESVNVNQVFQQLVHVHNAGVEPLRDVRLTQVCDLSVLGADRYQTVTIECIEPGETKTVRFSARATQPGAFAVRYVAENSDIQADVDDTVEITETSGRMPGGHAPAPRQQETR